MRTALIGILLLWLTGCASLFGTPETVTVEKGDTLYSISKRYDMPLRVSSRLTRLRSDRFCGCRQAPITSFPAATPFTASPANTTSTSPT